MISLQPEGIISLRRVIEKTDYVFFMKQIRGIGDFMDPWPVFDLMKKAIEKLETPFRSTFLLLQLGISAEYDSLAAEIGTRDLEGIISTGIWKRNGSLVETDNLVVLSYQDINVLVEINPWFETCTNRNTDIYIGSDSLRLAECLPYHRGTRVLDLCSGSGIQGLLAARSAGRVISAEINPKTVPVTRFNVLLNDMQDRMEVREGDLYHVLDEKDTFDYIYANPPFIPMLDSIDYPICGAGGEDGLMVLRSILAGLADRLKPGGKAVIFCECLGDENGVFFDREVNDYMEKHNMRCTVSLRGRNLCDYQIVRLAELTELFNKDFDREEFERKMHEIYQRLGAKYLYDIIYKIESCREGSDSENAEQGRMNYIRQYNQWDTDDRLERVPGYVFKRKGPVFDIFKDGSSFMRINMEQAEELSYLSRGNTVRETADWLYPRYKNAQAYKKYGKSSFVQAILDLCRLMEKSGVIRKIR